MRTFVIIGNNVIQDTFIKAGLYTFNATIKSHLPTHMVGFKGASGWIDVELPTNPNKFTKAHAIFELTEDVSQISLCRIGASTTNPIIVQTPMWTEGNNISTPSPNPDDLDETTNNVDIKLSTQILQTNEKIQLIATEEQFNEIGQGGVTAFGMIKVMAGDIELKVGKDGVISSINQSAEEIQINADRIRFTGSVEFENAVKNISPEAIRVELGIPFYEFKKENGVTIVETLSIPVNAFRGSERVDIPSSSITKVSSPNGITVSSVVGENNVTNIITQTSLTANGTVVLRVPVLGKNYDVDFNFKVIEKPKDGESNIIADLDNENQSISVDTDGTYMFGLPISTKFSIYAGATSLVLDSLTVQSISGVTATAIKETGIVTVTEVAKTVPDKIDLKITGKATVNSIQYTREAYLTINKIKKGDTGDSPILYELQPSVSQIKKRANGTLIPSTIYCRMIVTSASGSYWTTTLPYFLSAERSLDNGETWSSYSLGTSIDTSLINTSVRFRLYQQIAPVTMLDIETVMIVEDGDDGESNIISDLDNENQSIAVSEDGSYLFGLPITTKFTIYSGATELALDSLSVQSIDGVSSSTNKSTGVVTVTSIAKSVPDKVDIKITGKATVNGVQYTRESYLTINKARKGEKGDSPILYELQPSASQIKKSSNGTFTPESINCRLLVTDANGSYATTTKPNFLSVEYSLNNGDTWTSYSLGSSINTSFISNSIQFRLYQNTSPVTMIDIETIMVVEDGQSPKLYSLLPSTTEIHKNKNGVYSPSTISCKLIRNDENGHITLSAVPSGYRVQRQIDNGTPQTYTLGATTNTSTISETISYWIEQISPTTTIDRKDIKVINDGADGDDGKGISIKGSVDNYNQLLGLTGLSAGDAYFNKSDGKLYIWDGFNFPPNGQGIEFKGEAGKDGVSISSLIQQYINHTSKTVQPAQNANWLDKMPQYEDGLYMWSRFKMTLSNGQVQYSSYSLLEDFEAMMDSARIKNLIIYGDFSGEMKEIKSSNPVNYYPLGWRVSGLSHDSNGVPSDQNNIAPKIIKIYTGLPKGMLSGLRITPKTNLQGIYQNLSSNLVLNEVHTAYVFARKRNASSVAQIRLKYGSIMVTEDLTTTWARYVLKFTPTSQQPFEILFNKTGTWTVNDMVEISKIQLAQTELIFDYRQFSYIENAFAGSTSIEGGVVATRMVILSNEGGEIRSYVSGIDANPYAFAAGVSGFGTDLEKRNIGIKHDGTLIAKNADIEGEVSATGGKIGGFSLENMGLLSQNNRFFIDALNGAIYLLDENGEVKTSIIPNDLPSTPEAFFAGSGGGSLPLTALQGIYDDGQTKTTGTFTVDASGGKQFSLSIPEIKGSVNTDYTKVAGGVDGSSSTAIYFELMRGSNVHLDLGQAIVFSTGGLMTETFTIQQRTIQISSSGVYSLRARVVTNVLPSNHSATGGASVSIISSAEFIAVVNRSQIGNNGMIIASSTTRYDFMVGDKHIIRRGNYGFRITENGLQKSSNMNAPTPTWRNIEQPF